LLVVISALLSVNKVSISAYLTDLSSIPSVGWSLCVSVYPESVLWQNGWLDPDAVGSVEDGCIR